MAPEKNCTQCGGGVGPELAGTLCAACLLEELLGSAPDHVEQGDQNFRIKIFGGYELLQEIGRGGMGVVYKARQAGLNRIVALKMLLAGEFADAVGREQLLREAKVAAALYHPHIVTIHEVGEFDGRPFFAMEYIAGRNLSEIVRDGEITIETAARYVERIAQAVQYAHDHNVVHRDLKPANILIDERGEPRLTDFGLTKSLGEQTMTIVTAGSPNFMAPEQAASDRGPTGRHTDIFGLGGILYYLLTGRPPFAGQLLGETLKAVLDHDPVPPRKLRPEIPRDLETICLKCLEKKPANRYHDAAEVALELERWRKHEPIRARRSGVIEQTRKWGRRQPLAAGLILISTSLLIFAGALLKNLFEAISENEPAPRLPPSSEPAVFDSKRIPSLVSGRYTFATVTSDFNHDGLLDVASISFGENKLELFLGTGRLEFRKDAQYTTDQAPHALASGDLNHDGNVDLVCINQVANDVSIYLGGADGKFHQAPGSPVPVGKSPHGLAVADLNGDGHLDIVTSDFDASTLTVLLGEGDGRFHTGSVIHTGRDPWGLAAIDFDQDGLTDLLSTDVSDFTVRFWKGDGHGHFQLAKNFPKRVGARPVDVAAADFDRDGQLDIATADSNDGTVSILFTGRKKRLILAAGSSLPNGAYYPRKLAIADFNDDGFLDIATANETGTVGLILGAADGRFLRDQGSPYPGIRTVSSISIADLNADGKPDLVAACSANDHSGAIRFFLNQSPSKIAH